MACWGLACILAVVLYVRNSTSFAFSSARYWRFLCVPWKLVTCVIATTGITAVAPYTGDPTWDSVDAVGMSLLTFLSAPWVIGTLYGALRRQARRTHIFVALCMWLFSASWSYDGYLVLRDGAYPSTWLANLGASSVLYVAAGLLWNLDWREGRGVIFSFMDSNWPAVAPSAGFGKIFWYALPCMLLATAAILYFVLF